MRQRPADWLTLPARGLLRIRVRPYGQNRKAIGPCAKGHKAVKFHNPGFGGLERWNGMDWTGMDWNGMAGRNFVIKFCGRDQTLTCILASLATNALVQWKHDMNIRHKF